LGGLIESQRGIQAAGLLGFIRRAGFLGSGGLFRATPCSFDLELGFDDRNDVGRNVDTLLLERGDDFLRLGIPVGGQIVTNGRRLVDSCFSAFGRGF